MMDIEERFLWRHALICGLLWGLVVLMAVTLTQPVGNLAPLDLIYFMGTLSILWCGTGLVWAGGVKLAQEGRRPRVTFCLVLICAWAVSVMLGSYDAIVPGDGHLSRRVSLFDLAIYEFWINLFYGGLYTLGFFTIRRTQRLRRSLAALRLVRNQAETKLREARLQAVRGQLQPSILLEALDALKRTYIQDRKAGDRLFDLLIGFLRAAMPGLRRGASTLGAELTIIERYALLREALQTPSPPWRLQLAAPPADLSFPPLRLLPALDRLSRGAPAQTAIEVTAKPGQNTFIVRISLPAPEPLAAPTLDHLRRSMRKDLGVSAMMTSPLLGPVIAELHVTPTQEAAAPWL